MCGGRAVLDVIKHVGALVDVLVSAEARNEIFVNTVHYTCVCVDQARSVLFVSQIIVLIRLCSFLMR